MIGRAPRSVRPRRTAGTPTPWQRALAAGALAGLLGGSAACGTGGTSDPDTAMTATAPTTGAPTTGAPTSSGPVAPAVDTAALLTALQHAGASADVYLDAVVLAPDSAVLLATPETDRPVPSASLAKLLVVQQLLARIGAGTIDPDAATLAQLEQAITRSDNGAMNALWVDWDGAALVRQAAAEFGLDATVPPEEAGQWGNTPTTAADMARFLAAVAADPGPAGSATLLRWMRATTDVAADGFDQRFGLLSGTAGPRVAAKQGWACCLEGRRQLHSAGVLGDGRVVVVLADAPESLSYAQTRAVLDEAAAALVAGTA